MGDFNINILLMLVLSSLSCIISSAVITPVRKLLIDTDAGGDDAVAIIMATESENLKEGPKVVGITCVNGNAYVDNVALNVLKILKTVNRLDIPVYKGASHPLLLPDKKDYYFGQDGFGDFYYPDPPSTDLINETHAVNAMIDLVKQYPGELTILALGPLTNIALAVRIYPEFLDNLEELIVMGGSTEGRGNSQPGIEFNFAADPAANFVVFNSSTSRPTILIPRETTRRAGVPTSFRKSLTNSNNTKIWLIDSATATIATRKPNAIYSYWPDAVAAAVVLTSGTIVTKSEGYYSDAIYEGTKTAGMIVVDYTNITKNAANTNVIQNVNATVYLQLLSRYLL
ncbi:probable uridine nucleosidase 2 [Diprion similis]|uniref:probable uridine nucleosidase 2 n=1 Tax=Diprion similis TaxID=362088 RepID=UPI001EF977E2|nr:probable uridine nucleosidase 2 [Diprion similis]